MPHQSRTFWPVETCQFVAKIGVCYSGVTHGVGSARFQAYPVRLALTCPIFTQIVDRDPKRPRKIRRTHVIVCSQLSPKALMAESQGELQFTSFREYGCNAPLVPLGFIGFPTSNKALDPEPFLSRPKSAPSGKGREGNSGLAGRGTFPGLIERPWNLIRTHASDWCRGMGS